jgi:hypothetical protein
MAITNINIFQDNIVDGSNLLSVDNPLIFLFDVTYSGEAPDSLGIKLFDDSTLLLEQRAIGIRSIATGSIIRFRYDATKIIPSFFDTDSIDDVDQVENAFDQMAITKTMKIRAYDLENETLNVEIDFIAIRGSQQFGQYPNKIDLFNNTAKTFYTHPDYFTYVYFYNSLDGASIDINGNNVVTGANIGLYRYKVKVSTDTDYLFTVNSSDVVTHSVKVREEDCPNMIKFLDLDGFYRIWPFNRLNSITDNPSETGKIEKIIDTIYNDQAAKYSLGYNNVRSVSLAAKAVDSEQLLKLSEINPSPRVYYYVGDGTTDDKKDWVLVSIGGAIPVKLSNQNFADVNLSITLPEFQSIKTV